MEREAEAKLNWPFDPEQTGRLRPGEAARRVVERSNCPRWGLAAPPVIEPGPEDVLTERRSDGPEARLASERTADAAARIERTEIIGRGAEIDVKIFGLNRPITH